MSEAFLKNQLFEPFSQEKSDARTQYKGTGLGMSIVKGLDPADEWFDRSREQPWRRHYFYFPSSFPTCKRRGK